MWEWTPGKLARARAVNTVESSPNKAARMEDGARGRGAGVAEVRMDACTPPVGRERTVNQRVRWGSNASQGRRSSSSAGTGRAGEAAAGMGLGRLRLGRRAGGGWRSFKLAGGGRSEIGIGGARSAKHDQIGERKGDEWETPRRRAHPPHHRLSSLPSSSLSSSPSTPSPFLPRRVDGLPGSLFKARQVQVPGHGYGAHLLCCLRPRPQRARLRSSFRQPRRLFLRCARSVLLQAQAWLQGKEVPRSQTRQPPAFAPLLRPLQHPLRVRTQSSAPSIRSLCRIRRPQRRAFNQVSPHASHRPYTLAIQGVL